MRDIMNGKLSPNYPQCDLNLPNFAACMNTKGSPPSSYPIDPCGLANPGRTARSMCRASASARPSSSASRIRTAINFNPLVPIDVSRLHLAVQPHQCRRHRSGLPRHRLELARRVRRRHVVHELRGHEHPRQGQPGLRLGRHQPGGRCPLRLPHDRRRELLHELLPRPGRLLQQGRDRDGGLDPACLP